MKKIKCNGIVLNCWSVGEGEDVVLIHGLAANHAFWRLDVLLSFAKSHRVTIYDQRGHGYSEMPPEGYTSGDMAEDLHDLLRHHDISHAHLIGHSLGGLVALHYAAIHPERVSSLTIADSRVRAFQSNNYATDWPHWETATMKLKEIGLSVREEEAEAGLWLLEQLASTEWQQARDKLKGSQLFIPFGGWSGGNKSADRWLKLMKTTTAKKDLTSLAGLTVEKLSMIQVPTLALYGEHSPTLQSMRGLMEHLPHCKTVIVPGKGHFFPLTQPKLFFDIVSQFLNSLQEVKLR
ncbi:MAG: alpha/beta hydrolase [Nitrospirae bacterium]|nr:alpha/beta hydrolase [Nitrospirota bacterium]